MSLENTTHITERDQELASKIKQLENFIAADEHIINALGDNGKTKYPPRLKQVIKLFIERVMKGEEKEARSLIQHFSKTLSQEIPLETQEFWIATIKDIGNSWAKEGKKLKGREWAQSTKTPAKEGPEAEEERVKLEEQHFSTIYKKQGEAYKENEGTPRYQAFKNKIKAFEPADREKASDSEIAKKVFNVIDANNQKTERRYKKRISQSKNEPLYDLVNEIEPKKLVANINNTIVKSKPMENPDLKNKHLAPRLDAEDLERRGEIVNSFTFQTEKDVSNLNVREGSKLTSGDGKVFTIVKTFNSAHGQASMEIRENGARKKIKVEIIHFKYDPKTKTSELTVRSNDKDPQEFVFKKIHPIAAEAVKEEQRENAVVEKEEQKEIEREMKETKKTIENIELTPAQVEKIIAKLKEKIILNETEKIESYGENKEQMIAGIKEKFELYNIPFTKIEFIEQEEAEEQEEVNRESDKQKTEILENKRDIAKALSSYDKQLLLRFSGEKTLTLKAYDYLVTQAKNKKASLPYNKKLEELISKITRSHNS